MIGRYFQRFFSGTLIVEAGTRIEHSRHKAEVPPCRMSVDRELRGVKAKFFRMLKNPTQGTPAILHSGRRERYTRHAVFHIDDVHASGEKRQRPERVLFLASAGPTAAVNIDQGWPGLRPGSGRCHIEFNFFSVALLYTRLGETRDSLATTLAQCAAAASGAWAWLPGLMSVRSTRVMRLLFK